MSQDAADRIAAAVEPSRVRDSGVGKTLWRRLRHRWRHILDALRPVGGLSRGNRVEVYSDGDAGFEAMWEAIHSTRERVWLETYAYRPDRVGTRTLEALTGAAARGCDVILLYDHVGSPSLSDDFLAPLRDAGGRAVAFNPMWPWRRRGPLSFRDHRKILVADDVGFCGSMNISEEYAGPRLGTNRFRDTHLRLEGPAVAYLAELFRESLAETRARRPDLDPEVESGRDGVFVQVLASNPRRNRRAIQRSLQRAVRAARQTCHVTNPYFLPSRRITRALVSAARRGVDVRILSAGRSDVPPVRFAAQHVYGRYLRAGARIYELQGQALHAKLMTVDGVYASVGSFNLDPFSDRRNLEVTVNILDAATAARLDGEFQSDLERTREVTLEDWKARSRLTSGLQWAVYQLLHI